MSFIAIDPGVHRCACAGFDDFGWLTHVWFETAVTFKRGDVSGGIPTAALRHRATAGASAIVVEQPQVDGRTRTARAQDILGLAWHGALLAGEFAGRDACPVVAVTPFAWKGAEPKPQQHGRLWALLRDDERRVLGGLPTGDRIVAARKKGALSRWSKPGASYYGAWDGHNLLDAAALGLWYANRLERR